MLALLLEMAHSITYYYSNHNNQHHMKASAVYLMDK